ncbi:hypothetical protein HS041_22540 [Planomonospora sp. ID67723]|uniref:hypothetical protein n=1 Tax=Planomonospora sp. ID67723 TaxID=2738134 RepID=UPI0018C425F8|nr:hypothetical protein [Planomonospora sp. ID67723]MBG0830544.1 hypothetical protein [Planomonospora sp. ID67723]
MGNRFKSIRCACCDKPGWHVGRGLIESCYARHRSAKTLDQFPRTLRPTGSGWSPHGPHGKRMLARYIELDQLGFSPRRIAFEMGVGPRQIARYKATLKEMTRG